MNAEGILLHATFASPRAALDALETWAELNRGPSHQLGEVLAVVALRAEDVEVSVATRVSLLEALDDEDEALRPVLSMQDDSDTLRVMWWHEGSEDVRHETLAELVLIRNKGLN